MTIQQTNNGKPTNKQYTYNKQTMNIQQTDNEHAITNNEHTTKNNEHTTYKQ